MTNRVLIAMCDSGGGHKASAEALAAAFEARCGPEVQVDIVDLWLDHTRWPINQLPKSYRFLTSDTPWLWELIWKTSATSQLTTPLLSALTGWLEDPIRDVILRHDPHLIISVHPLMQEVPLRILKRMRRHIPFATVITDLGTIHPTWYHPKVTLTFVPSEEAYQQGLLAGLRPQQLRQYGLPIRPVFALPARPKEELRRELGLEQDLPTVLLTGGGEGIGPLVKIARAVADGLATDSRAAGRPVAQLAVICGRNQKVREELASHAWPIPTLVAGFVPNMWDWMAASDCIVTKAGPGTIAEALSRGLPILLSGYIRGQEEGNVLYVVENELGVYADEPGEIARIISRWMGPGWAEMEAIAERAKRMARPEASFEIVEEVRRLLECASPAGAPAPTPASVPRVLDVGGKGQ